MNIIIVEQDSETLIIQDVGVQGAVGEGVPPGGTSGQILAKVSGSNYDTHWINSGLGMTGTPPIVVATNNISILQSGAGSNGYLSSIDWNTFNNKQNALGFTPENSANKGIANGYAPLDGTNHIPISYIPAGIAGGLTFLGLWNASTNTPTIVSGVGTNGDYYKVSVAGNTVIDGIGSWAVGDWIIFNGTAWDKIANYESVVSVNGFTGAVVLTTDNISQGATNLYFTSALARAALSALTPLTYNSTTGQFDIQQADATQSGYLLNTDWAIFNGKQNALTFGNLTESTSSVLTILNGTGAVIGSGTSIQVKQASASQGGFLSSVDWSMFDAKQNALGYTPANDSLSNLSTTSINQSLLPNANNTLNLGDTGLAWNDLYVSNIRDYNNNLRFDVTGGNLYDTSSNPSVSLDSYTLFYLGNPILNWSSGNFFDGSGFLSADFFNRRLYNSTGNLTIDWENNFLYNGSTGNVIFEIDTSVLRDQNSRSSLDANQRLLQDTAAITSINYNSRELIDSSANVAISYGTPGNVLAQYDFQANGRIRAGRLEIQGASGAGYIDLPLQNPNATSGVNGTRLFSNSSGDLSFIEASDGLIRTFSGTLTANRTYTLQNDSGTIAFLSDIPPATSYTFSTGLTNTSNTITVNLSTGKAGGQSAIGGTASGEGLTLSSTSNATKGKILFGSSAYDEANNRLGIGTTSPATPFHLVGTARLASYTIGAIPFIDLNTNLAQDTTSFWWDATNARLALGTSVTGTNYPPTMTSNSAPSPYVASASVGNSTAFNAFDNNGNTSWNSGATTGILTIDMGSTITVNQYAVTGPWNVSVNAAPRDWTFEGSPNGSSWTTLDTRTAQSIWAFSETKTYTLSASQSYRYYRLNVTANNGSSIILITQLTISNATPDHVTPLAKAHIGTYLASSSAGAIGQIIQAGQAGQTSDWFQIRDQSANVLASFSSTPGTYLNFGDLAGRSAFGAIGTVVAGDKIIFKNGSGDGSTGKFAIGLNTNNNYYIQAIGTTGQPNLDFVTGNSTTGAANVRFTFTSNVLINTTTDTGHKLSIVDTTSAGSGSLAFSTINMATTWNTTGSPPLINGTITATAFGTSSKWANFTTGTANTYLGVLSSTASANTSEQAFYATNGTNAVLIGVGSGGVAPAGTVYFRVNSSTGISFSSTTTSIPTGYLNMSGTSGSNQITGNQSSASTAITALKLGPNTPSSGALTMTAGGQVDVQIGGLSNYSFAPTSGTATYTQFQTTPTINQTGGASGITRSIYVNPTLTSAYDYRAFESTAGKVIMGGSLSSPAWLLNGAQLSVITGTYTDTTSSGTVANVAVNAIAQPGIAASSVTTYTNAATLYIANAPSAGANVTLSNAYALWVGSGRTVLGGAVTINSTVNASSGASGAFTFGAGVVGNNPTMSLRSANSSVEALNISNVGGLAQIGFYNANTASDTRGRIGWNNTNMVVQSVSTPLLFLTDSNERMRIDNSTGYVGVGVTSPSALLSVAGSTTARASINIATGTAPTSANSGDIWHDATQKTTYINNAGVNQSHSGTLFTQTADATCANTTTETTLTSTGVGTLTLPANFFVAGKTIKLLAYGFHSSTGGTTVTIRVKLGSTTILTATGSSGSDTNAGIIMDTVITCRTTGASGTVAGQGVYTEIGNSPNFRQMTNTAPVTVDTTTSQAITMTAQWGAASAGRTITVTNLSVQVLN